MKLHSSLKLITTAAVIAIISGCASSSHEKQWVTTDHYVYKGLNASSTAGPKQIEVPASVSMPDQVLALLELPAFIPTAQQKATMPKYGAADVVISGITAPTGISQAGDMAVSALFWAVSAECKSCVYSGNSATVAFVPKDKAQTPEAAYQFYIDGLQSYYRALEADGLIDTIQNVGYTPSNMWLVNTKEKLTTLDGKRVFEDGVPIWHNTVTTGNALYPISISDGFAPKELGGYPAYVIQEPRNGSGLSIAKSNVLYVSKHSDAESMKKRATLTPKWMAFYFPPNSVTIPTEGKRVAYSLPAAILNGELGFYTAPK